MSTLNVTSQNTARIWTANTAYSAGQIAIAPDGSVIRANNNLTSGATYSATNWTVLSNSPTVSINTVGSANNPVTDASAARLSGLAKVFWQCPTQPANWINGDEWINNA